MTERTIYRDLHELEGAGVPIKFDHPSDSYRIDRGFFMPPVQLDLEESLALMVLCEHVAASDKVAFTEPAQKAFEKIAATLPEPVHAESRAVLDGMTVHLAPTTPSDDHRDVYATVRRALADRRCLRCIYDAATSDSGGPDEFDFEPYHLLFSVRAWYAIGYHAAREEIRTLKLSRFASIKPTDRPFEIPSEFSVKDYLGHAWRMIRGEPRAEVVLEFDAEFAETVADTLWHRTQRVEFREDGSAEFRCTVDGFDEILWWILSMGSHCRVVEPAVLRELVISERGTS